MPNEIKEEERIWRLKGGEGVRDQQRRAKSALGSLSLTATSSEATRAYIVEGRARPSKEERIGGEIETKDPAKREKELARDMSHLRSTDRGAGVARNR